MISTTADQDESGIDEHLRQDPGGIRPPIGEALGGLRRRTAGIEETDGKVAPDPDEEMIDVVTALHEDRSIAATKRMLVGMEVSKRGGMKGTVKNLGKPLEDSAPCRRRPSLRRGTVLIEDRGRPRQVRRWHTGAQRRRALRQVRVPRPASSEQRAERVPSSADRASSTCTRSETSMLMLEKDQFLDLGSWTCSAGWIVRWSTRHTKTR